MKIMKKLLVLSVASLAMVASVKAQDNVFDIGYYYPDSSTLYQDLGNLTADGVSSESIFGQFTFTATDSTITMDAIGLFDGGTASFNGFIFSLNTPADTTITSLTLTDNSDPDVNSSQFSYSGNQISWDLSAISGTTGQAFTLDYTDTASVPEPTTLALSALAGTVGLVMARRNRRK